MPPADAPEGGCVLHAPEGGRPWPGVLPATLDEEDVRLVWTVERLGVSGLRDPFDRPPGGGDPYYDFEIHLAGDYVYPLSESIEPFPDVASACGRHLVYEAEDGSPFAFTSRIARVCPDCGSRFRPLDHVARVTEVATGEAAHRPGGVAYRFALVVDSGKAIPFAPPAAPGAWRRLVGRFRGERAPRPRPVRVVEELSGLLTDVLGRPFDQIGTYS
ncbi:hypothetical protein [Paludisphaera soli]|uniref:hypothetical protein n=1 Tax=Paludisphaera soli TaxID=2712865 RepID=UPI0013ED177B|nr:hypothetical protein [Paludisphaera soli]